MRVADLLILSVPQDTAKKILKAEACGQSEAEKVTSFLRSSWIEIPDRTSTSRFMRPRYVVKKADNLTGQDAGYGNNLKDISDRGFSQTGILSPHEQAASVSWREAEERPQVDHESTEKRKSFAVSATYVSYHSPIVTLFGSLIPVKMPYLYPSTYHRSESGEQTTNDPSDNQTQETAQDEEKVPGEIKMRQELFKAYESSTIHQPATLDEFYYQFASDAESVQDRKLRNKDQAITKYLVHEDIEKQRFWPLLRVGQLWIWTIDNSVLCPETVQYVLKAC